MAKAKERTITQELSMTLTKADTAISLMGDPDLTPTQQQALIVEARAAINIAHDCLVEMMALIRKL